MAIDWNQIFQGAVDAAVNTSKASEAKLRGYLKDIQAQHEAALVDITKAYATGGIDKATFESSLEDEMETLRNELSAMTVVAKAAAQRAANAFVEALTSALKTAVFAAI